MKTASNMEFVGRPSFSALHETEQEWFAYKLLQTVKKFYENPENRKAFEIWKKEKRRIARQEKQKRATISTDQSDMVTLGCKQPATKEV